MYLNGNDENGGACELFNLVELSETLPGSFQRYITRKFFGISPRDWQLLHTVIISRRELRHNSR